MEWNVHGIPGNYHEILMNISAYKIYMYDVSEYNIVFKRISIQGNQAPLDFIFHASRTEAQRNTWGSGVPERPDDLASPSAPTNLFL